MLPPLSICWDECVLPKWYACGIALCLLLFYFIVKNSTINNRQMKTAMRKGISLAASLGIVYESIWVVSQIIHNGIDILRNGICGTFDNPSGLSTSICILLPLAFLNYSVKDQRNFKNKCNQKISVLVYNILIILLAVILVLLSQSRTGLMSLVVMAVIVIYKYSPIKRLYKQLFIVIFLTIAGVTVTQIKTNSTKGRFFILEQTWTIIKKRPVTGYGIHGFQREYMKQQGSYLSRHPMDPEVKLADEVKHPLNEFVLLWLDFGIIGPLLLTFLLAVSVYAFYESIPILTMVSSILISCLFSYPFNEPLPWFILFGLFSASLWRFIPFIRIITEKRKSRGFCLFLCVSILSILIIFFRIDTLMSSANFYAIHHKHHHSLERYELLDSMFRHPPYLWAAPYRRSFFRYNYSYELFTIAQFDLAYKKTRECSVDMSDYDLELLTGDICLHRKDSTNALLHYLLAYNMCPVRFAPLNGLLNLYQTCHDSARVNSIASLIKRKSVKVPSTEIDRIKETANNILCAHDTQ
jgi:O-antigen ligase